MPKTIAPRPSRLVLLDVAIAPVAAFTQSRESPTWILALIIATLLGVIATLAIGPTVAHALGQELTGKLAASPQVARLPADQRSAFVAQQVGIAQTVTRYSFLAIPIGIALGSFFQALVMLIANAIGRGDGTFRRLWAVSVTPGSLPAGSHLWH